MTKGFRWLRSYVTPAIFFVRQRSIRPLGYTIRLCENIGVGLLVTGIDWAANGVTKA